MHRNLIEFFFVLGHVMAPQKSTYFSIFDNGETLTFKGKGFGHGVGLSQEGAMRMIEIGYDFLEVLRFYYTDVHLIDMKMREFYIID